MTEYDDDDVDVCLGCGRYYGMTQTIEDLWRKSFNYSSTAVMPQLCHRCMCGDAPPQEKES